MATAQTEWLTIAEACAYLRVTRATLYRWAREGKVRLYRLGHRATRVRRLELEEMLLEKTPAISWTKVSEPSFARDWDNDKDAAYDNWGSIYDVRKR